MEYHLDHCNIIRDTGWVWVIVRASYWSTTGWRKGMERNIYKKHNRDKQRERERVWEWGGYDEKG